jgi:hypothetical protein
MINPNKGASQEVLIRLRTASYERFRLELLRSIEQLLVDFGMTWNELAEALGDTEGVELKQHIGDSNQMDLCDLNDIAHIFSTEPYVIFRPRFPWTQS